jgi:hypothetical protein
VAKEKETDTTRVCGYCYTNTHELCRPEIKWYDSVWYCYCKTCNKQEKEKGNEKSIQSNQEGVLEGEPSNNSEPGTGEGSDSENGLLNSEGDHQEGGTTEGSEGNSEKEASNLNSEEASS